MALSNRKKRGIGFLVGGVAFLAAGGIFLGLDSMPDMLGVIFQVVAAVGTILGFIVVFPDIGD